MLLAAKEGLESELTTVHPLICSGADPAFFPRDKTQDVRELLAAKRDLESELAAVRLEASELAASLAEAGEAKADLEEAVRTLGAHGEELEARLREAEAREQAVSP